MLEGNPVKRDVVGVKEDIPQFMGTDMKTYGPYKTGDVVTLPLEISKFLMERDSVRKIETGD